MNKFIGITLLLFLFQKTFSQDKKSFYYYENETITLKFDKKLEVVKAYESSKYISKTNSW